MKRNIFALILCVCMVFSLLCGCSGAEAPAQVPGDVSVSDGAPKAPVTEAPTEAPAPETSAPAAERELLTKIGNVMDAQEWVRLHALGENLLVISEREIYDDASQSFAYGTVLTLVSPKDGSVLETYTFNETKQWGPSVAHDYVMLENKLFGNIAAILDSTFSPVEYDSTLPDEIPLTGNVADGYCWGYWVSSNLRFLYVMYGKSNGSGFDLLRVDREKDEVRTLAKNMDATDVRYDGGQYVLLNNNSSKGLEACSLNLETGELEKAPVQELAINRFGDSWLQLKADDFSEFYVHTSEADVTVRFGDPLDPDDAMHYHAVNSFHLVNENHLFLGGDYGWQGTLYDVSGKFISHYEFPEPVGQDDFFFTVSQPVWSEADGGYYLLVNGLESCDLYFWDIYAEVEPMQDLT